MEGAPPQPVRARTRVRDKPACLGRSFKHPVEYTSLAAAVRKEAMDKAMRDLSEARARVEAGDAACPPLSL